MFRKGRLPAIVGTQWRSIEGFFSEERTGRTVMPHELASASGVDLKTARSLLLALAADAEVDLFLAIFIKGEDHFCELRPFADGKPQFPLSIEDRDETVIDPSDVSYEMVAKVTQPVSFT